MSHFLGFSFLTCKLAAGSTSPGTEIGRMCEPGLSTEPGVGGMRSRDRWPWSKAERMQIREMGGFLALPLERFSPPESCPERPGLGLGGFCNQGLGREPRLQLEGTGLEHKQDTEDRRFQG